MTDVPPRSPRDQEATDGLVMGSSALRTRLGLLGLVAWGLGEPPTASSQ